MLLKIFFVALFPGLLTVQFLIACSMQKGRGRPGPFCHLNDVSVYLGRQRGEGSPIERVSLRPYLVDSAQSTGVSNVHKVTNVPVLIQNEECLSKMHSFGKLNTNLSMLETFSTLYTKIAELLTPHIL